MQLADRAARRGIKRFVAQSKDRVYVVDTANRLQARDAATGLLIGAVSVAGFELASANLQSDRIYLASPYGVVQCLREARLATPLAHTPGLAIPPPPKPGDPAPAADPSAAPAPRLMVPRLKTVPPVLVLTPLRLRTLVPPSPAAVIRRTAWAPLSAKTALKLVGRLVPP